MFLHKLPFHSVDERVCVCRDEIETWIIEADEDAELHDRMHGWKNAQLSLKAKWTSATKAKKKVTPCSVCATYEFPELILNACSSWYGRLRPPISYPFKEALHG